VGGTATVPPTRFSRFLADRDIPMVTLPDVLLEVATHEHASLLSNLLELYIHDLSQVFDVEPGSDGRFGYEKLPLYWSEPERRFPFLILAGGRLAGFALVARASPSPDAADVFDVAEFFVLRRHRRAGVGRRAAFLLWNRFRGRWTVRVSEANRGALRFWTGITAEYTSGAATIARLTGESSDWRTFSFDSVGPTV
jgi:predicted acetyltransferase